MRTATQGTEFLRTAEGTIFGIGLGFDFCAEHEWGCEELYSAFGVDQNHLGLPGRTIRKLSPGLFLYDRKGGIWMGFDDYLCRSGIPSWNEFKKSHPYDATLRWGDRQIVTAWNKGSFAIHLSDSNEDVQQFLRDLFAAFSTNDIAFWIHNGGAFKVGARGLCVVIPSRTPDIHKKTMYDADVDRRRLEAAAAATGIVEFLRKAGDAKGNHRSWDRPFGYFALSPRWIDASEKSMSAYPVIFWLNPYEQKRNNFGWFTVEQLQEWTRGEGPIPKEAE